MTTVQLVPIDKIRVINARGRSKGKFREIVENISKIGLKKPITVSRREGEDGFDLVCGQGRLEAYIAYGAREIPAVVVDIPLEDRLLCSLVENLTRRTPSCLELARDLAGLKERGHSLSAIAALTGVSESYVVQLIRNVQASVRRHSDIGKLRFLLYPSRLPSENVVAIRQDDAGVEIVEPRRRRRAGGVFKLQREDGGGRRRVKESRSPSARRIVVVAVADEELVIGVV